MERVEENRDSLGSDRNGSNHDSYNVTSPSNDDCGNRKRMLESRSDDIESSDHEDRASKEDIETTFRAEETFVSTDVGRCDPVVRKVTEHFPDRESNEGSEVDKRDRLEVVAIADWGGEGEDDRGRDVDA